MLKVFLLSMEVNFRNKERNLSKNMILKKINTDQSYSIGCYRRWIKDKRIQTYNKYNIRIIYGRIK